MKRDLKASLDRLASMANSPEREQCADTMHEIAIHNTERAIEAEALVRELVAALQGVSGMLDYVQKRADKALAKAKEVLGDEV